MKFIAMRELKADPSKALDELAENKDGFLVTRDGKVAAMLTYFDEDLLEEYVLTHDPKLVKELEDALEEGRREGGVDHETMKRMIERGG
ncbi:MAG: hypothetical protein ACYSU0_16260 [Planctomycetota bacterium]|jgi:hypothetical protein